MRKILVIRLSSLGDIILTSPTVLNLQFKYPNAEICFLTKEQYANIAGALSGIARVLTISNQAKLSELVKLALKLDDEQFDLIVDLRGNFRSRMLTALVSATEKTTYSKHRSRRERIVRYKTTSKSAPHTIDSYNNVLRKIDLNFPLSVKRPTIDKKFYMGRGRELSTEVGRWLNRGDDIILIAPGARHETKRAPLELFKTICDKLLAESAVKIVSAFQSSEGGLSLKSELASDRFTELVDLPLDELAFLLSRSKVAVSNDSAVAHLSSAVGTPVLALFGPTHSALGFSPRGVYDRVIENDEYCRPCSLHGSKKCSREKRYCFTRLSGADIGVSVLETLELQKSLRPALFMDRDGTIIEERHFLSDPEQVVFHEGVFESLRTAKSNGFKLVVVTNQSGVARGLMSEDDVRAVNGRVVSVLAENDIEIEAVYSASGHPEGVIERFRSPDNSRKPGEEMFVRASLEHGIDLRRSWVIGDRASDYLSARAIGALGGALVLTGYGQKAYEKIIAGGVLQPDIVAPDLAGAISAILEGE